MINKKYNEYYKARNIIKDIIEKDLVGPIFDDEVIIEIPEQYYSMGKLYPQSDEINIIEESGSSLEMNLASTNMKKPSSMGITCTLKKNIKKVNVNIEFGIYEPLSVKEIEDRNIKLEKWKDDVNEKTIYWLRNDYKFSLEMGIEENAKLELIHGISINGFLHKVCGNGEKIFTLVLINEQHCKKENKYTSEKMIFQPHIKISAVEKTNKNIFTSTLRQVEIKEDAELLEMDMLYSDYKCYGQGHGCSVNWGNSEHIEVNEPEYVESKFISEYRLRQMKATQIDDLPILEMKYIFKEKPLNVIKQLYDFAESYNKWIIDIEKKSSEVEARMYECAKNNIKKCKEAHRRIVNSIKLLEVDFNEDGLAWNAFKYANEAMYLQRVQTLKKQGKRFQENELKWYPFQLAFFLQELGCIIEPKNDDRKVVDLLWFPTGGGKTEAYLGIAAFTIFYRRMKYGEKGEGVSVIMRYTLRLLTMQQFERASMLICACELLRKKYDISKKTIEIGLWVGNTLTPKNVDNANKSLKKLHQGSKLADDEANPCQIKVCPWCGELMTIDNYSVSENRDKMIVKCSNNECEYSEFALPIRLTDQEIYHFTPAFIVATIDKFAQITLKNEPAAIFGIDSVHNPPDLIIQDELHLISGPLGTMTGIYEAAITKICENNGVPIKIVASTATIKNAKNQINALYGRNFTQFPPQGISIDDSYFAEKSTEQEKPSRLYLGYMGVGVTFTTTLIRIYADWLFASRYLIDLGYDDKVVDNFWTMTGYFNSLRELGGTRTQVVDSVQSRYQYLKARKFGHLVPKFTGNERYDFSEELTSRMSNDRISEIIQKGLKKSFVRGNSDDVYDFVLASNMISVGVDVGRLGTMAVTGQPKTNSEYIQATSRIGRDNPGMIFMIYNSARSRDRSYYEQFLKYHSAMYRYVEASSLTPFSDRARDRGLQALFVTLCRYLIKDLRVNSSAGNFNPESKEVLKIEQIIKDYVKNVDKRELENVELELKDIKDEWYKRIVGELYYKEYSKEEKNSLLKADIDEEDRFRTMNSMRSVEQECGIYLLGGD